MNIESVLLGLGGGMAIEFFFRTVKYHDSASKNGPTPKYSYANYMTVSEYISGGRRKRLSYLLFRALPPAIVLLLLVCIMDRYFTDSQHVLVLALAGLASLLLRDGYALFQHKSPREKMIHLGNITLVAMVTACVIFVDRRAYLGTMAPTMSGLVDNLWASLIIGLLIILYLDTTNMSTDYRIETERQNLQNNYILDTYDRLFNRLNGTVHDAATTYAASPLLLYAIIIYENMNRPRLFRVIENLAVMLFRVELTVGIAQVRSYVRLSDGQSIAAAANLLQGSIIIDGDPTITQVEDIKLQELLKGYNTDNRYSQEIKAIITTLRTYNAAAFPVAKG